MKQIPKNIQYLYGLIASLQVIKTMEVSKNEALDYLEYDSEETPHSPEDMQTALNFVYGES